MPQLNINGQSFFADAPPDTPLLWVIREDLRLTGTKYGCELGLCGSPGSDRLDGSEDRDIPVKVAGNPVTYKGQPYLLHSVLPNFFFHTTTAYDILRHCGVEIGKRDFIGQV